MQLDSKRTFIATWKTLKARLLDTSRSAAGTIGWLPSWTLNVDDKSDRPFAHLLIYPSAWLPFFPSHRAPPLPLHLYITFNWIPAMKFHPQHCSLFLSPFPPPPHCIKSRDHFAAILCHRLSLSSTHPRRPCVPFRLSPYHSASFQTLAAPSCTRVGLLNITQLGKVTTKKRDMPLPKRIRYAQQFPFYLKAHLCAWNAVALQVRRIYANVDCLRLNVVTRNSYSDKKYYNLLLREFMYV